MFVRGKRADMQFPPAGRTVLVDGKPIAVVSDLVDLYREKVNPHVLLVNWDLGGYDVGAVVSHLCALAFLFALRPFFVLGHNERTHTYTHKSHTHTHKYIHTHSLTHQEVLARTRTHTEREREGEKTTKR